jgi:hypothetical protein
MVHYHQAIEHVDQDVQYASRCSDHSVLCLTVVNVSLDTTFIFEIFIPSSIICIIVYLFCIWFHPFPTRGS